MRSKCCTGELLSRRGSSGAVAGRHGAVGRKEWSVMALHVATKMLNP